VQLLVGERHLKKKHRHLLVCFDWLERGILNHWSDPAFCQWNGSCYRQAQRGRKGGWNSDGMKLHQPHCAIRGEVKQQKKEFLEVSHRT